MQQLPKLLVIVGPTASGKSALAVRLAQEFSGELISADSRQVYRGMDIGTAKLVPPLDVKQWLVDVAEPDQRFTLADFKKRAEVKIEEITKRGKLPLLVGGTGLYVSAVVYNWQLPTSGEEEDDREIVLPDCLEDQVNTLKKIDPASAATIDLQNPRRVVRALTFAVRTGKSFVSEQKKGEHKYDALQLGIDVDREALRDRLRQRVMIMLDDGLIEETKRLLARYKRQLPSMTGISYPEVAEHLAGELTKDELIEKITTNCYQYARRQLTWWRREKDILWLRDTKQASHLVNEWLGS